MVKKNITFFVSIGVLIALFLVGIVMLFLAHSEENKITKNINRYQRALGELLESQPSLTEQVELDSEKNITHLAQVYDRKTRLVEARNPILTETDDNRFLGSVRDHIKILTNLCRSDENKEQFKIKIPEKFGFGFAQYFEGTTFTEEMKPYVSIIDKQRQLLEHLSKALIESGPDGITNIKREYLEHQDQDGQERTSTAEDRYKLNPLLSVRKEGVVDTLAFELSFYGHTSSLRKFLNRVSDDSYYPLIVQDIRVKSSSKKEIEESAFRSNEVRRQVDTTEPSSAFAALFGVSPQEEKENEEDVKEVTMPTRPPLIKEDASSFTVVVEYIEYIYDIEEMLGSNETLDQQSEFE